MLEYAAVMLASASSNDERDPVTGFIVFVVIFGLGYLILTRVLNRKGRKNVAAATGGAAGAFALPITPHAPLEAHLAAVRQLIGMAGAAPRISSYSRPVVTVDANGLVISEKKLGVMLSIAAADISSIEVRAASIKPRIAPAATSVPSVWLTVKRGDAQAEIALTPLVSVTAVATQAQAQAYANDLSANIDALR